jgi:predicted RNA-binding Zn ribbon-like protein
MPELPFTREVDSERGFFARAGHRCLDLVNTVAWRLDPNRRQDRLPDDAAALAWAVAFALCADDEAAQLATNPSGSVAADLRQAREHIYAAAIEGHPGSANALLDLDREWWSRVELEPTTSRTWRARERVFDQRSLALRVGHDAVRILTEESAPIKQCSDDACGWIYLDTSPRRNRRWCAAQDCGARNRARDHYRRRKQSQHAGARSQ